MTGMIGTDDRKAQMTKRTLIIACALNACTLFLLLNVSCARRANPGTGQTPSGMSRPVRVSAENVDAAEPSMAAARDGSAYVVWIEHRAKKEADVLLARLDSEGRMSAAAPVRVNPKVGEATGWRGDPPTVMVAPDRTVYVGWTARVVTGADRTANDLYLSASHDEGRSFGPPVKVNDDEKPAVHGMHSLAVASDGRVYMAWLDERNTPPPAAQMQATGKTMEHMEQNRELFFAFSTDGGRSFSKNQRLASEVCPCCKTALAAGPDNLVYAGWRQVLPGDFRHIAVAASSDGGRTFGPPRVISDDGWKITGCPVSGPGLAVMGDGALRAVWYTAGERGQAGLYWAESRDHGQTFSPRQLLASGQVRGNPHLLVDERNNLITVWESDEEREPRVLSARLGADGSVTPGASSAGSAELPAVAITGAQIFVGYIVSDHDLRSIWVTRAAVAS
jgi:hypothetical protein